MKPPAANYKLPTTVLAIESSADETAAALVTKQPDEQLAAVISQTTATSLAKHQPTKGIVPEVAAREQVKFIILVLEETLKKLPDKFQPDAIAVTTQPGLIGSLLVGVETARTLAAIWNLPVIPVNHIEAHPYANFISKSLDSTPGGEKVETTVRAATREGETVATVPIFPLLSWVISGGHTQLRCVESHQKNQLLGESVDDAVGECLDKCARVLGGDYPGGPFIEELARKSQRDNVATLQPATLPRPLLHEDTFNLSFSGLKTAFVRKFQELVEKKEFDISIIKQSLAFELQQAIADVLMKKTAKAIEKFPETKSILISGGVSANTFLQSQFQAFAKANNLAFFTPPLNLNTDNAVMIGAYALFHPELQTSWEEVEANPKKNQ